ncbi:uncharacterized protein LOC127708567 isoform X2 [Mytilus californianus]|uniref:uncharacterized protein LOC127708567 isoform X2 n=1 Tax=Mytilus californianus TaxID=6549 RepID=UPI0022481045|nr:uncharacterized protein LOC127708567 isoform X2 [Mytilus californianus]
MSLEEYEEGQYLTPDDEDIIDKGNYILNSRPYHRHGRGRSFHQGYWRGRSFQGRGKPLRGKFLANTRKTRKSLENEHEQENRSPNSSLERSRDSKEWSYSRSYRHSREKSPTPSRRSNSRGRSHRTHSRERSHRTHSRERSHRTHSCEKSHHGHRSQDKYRSRSRDRIRSRSPRRNSRGRTQKGYSREETRQLNNSRDNSDHYRDSYNRDDRNHQGNKRDRLKNSRDRHNSDESRPDQFENRRRSAELRENGLPIESDCKYSPNMNDKLMNMSEDRSSKKRQNVSSLENKLSKKDNDRRDNKRRNLNKSQRKTGREHINVKEFVAEGLREIRLGEKDKLIKKKYNGINNRNELQNRMENYVLTSMDIECLHKRNDRYHFYRDPNKSTDTTSSSNTSNDPADNSFKNTKSTTSNETDVFDNSFKNTKYRTSNDTAVFDNSFNNTKSRTSNVMNIAKGISKVCQVRITADGKRSFTDIKEDERYNDDDEAKTFKQTNEGEQNVHCSEIVHSNEDDMDSGKSFTFRTRHNSFPNENRKELLNNQIDTLTNLPQSVSETSELLCPDLNSNRESKYKHSNDMHTVHGNTVDTTIHSDVRISTDKPRRYIPPEEPVDNVPYFTNISRSKTLVKKLNSRKPLLPTPPRRDSFVYDYNQSSVNKQSLLETPGNCHNPRDQILPNIPDKEKIDSAIDWFMRNNSNRFNLPKELSENDSSGKAVEKSDVNTPQSHTQKTDIINESNNTNTSHQDTSEITSPSTSLKYQEVQSDGHHIYTPFANFYEQSENSEERDKSKKSEAKLNLKITLTSKSSTGDSNNNVHRVRKSNNVTENRDVKSHNLTGNKNIKSINNAENTEKPGNENNQNSDPSEITCSRTAGLSRATSRSVIKSKSSEGKDGLLISGEQKDQTSHSSKSDKQKDRKKHSLEINVKSKSKDNKNEKTSREKMKQETRKISTDRKETLALDQNINNRNVPSSPNEDSFAKNKLTSTPVTIGKSISYEKDLFLSPVLNLKTLNSGSKEKKQHTSGSHERPNKSKCMVTSQTLSESDCSADNFMLVDSWHEGTLSNSEKSKNASGVESKEVSVDKEMMEIEKEADANQNIFDKFVHKKKSEKRSRSPLRLSELKKINSDKKALKAKHGNRKSVDEDLETKVLGEKSNNLKNEKKSLKKENEKRKEEMHQNSKYSSSSDKSKLISSSIKSKVISSCVKSNEASLPEKTRVNSTSSRLKVSSTHEKSKTPETSASVNNSKMTSSSDTSDVTSTPIHSLFGRKIRTGLEDLPFIITPKKDKPCEGIEKSNESEKSSINIPENLFLKMKKKLSQTSNVVKRLDTAKTKTIKLGTGIKNDIITNQSDKKDSEKKKKTEEFERQQQTIKEENQKDKTRINLDKNVHQSTKTDDGNDKIKSIEHKSLEKHKPKQREIIRQKSHDKNKNSPACGMKEGEKHSAEKEHQTRKQKSQNDKAKIRSVNIESGKNKLTGFKDKTELTLETNKVSENIDRTVSMSGEKYQVGNTHRNLHNETDCTKSKEKSKENNQDNIDCNMESSVDNNLESQKDVDENTCKIVCSNKNGADDYNTESTVSVDESFECVGIIENVDLNTVSLSADELEKLENVQNVEVSLESSVTTSKIGEIDNDQISHNMSMSSLSADEIDEDELLRDMEVNCLEVSEEVIVQTSFEENAEKTEISCQLNSKTRDVCHEDTYRGNICQTGEESRGTDRVWGTADEMVPSSSVVEEVEICTTEELLPCHYEQLEVLTEKPAEMAEHLSVQNCGSLVGNANVVDTSHCQISTGDNNHQITTVAESHSHINTVVNSHSHINTGVNSHSEINKDDRNHQLTAGDDSNRQIDTGDNSNRQIDTDDNTYRQINTGDNYLSQINNDDDNHQITSCDNNVCVDTLEKNSSLTIGDKTKESIEESAFVDAASRLSETKTISEINYVCVDKLHTIASESHTTMESSKCSVGTSDMMENNSQRPTLLEISNSERVVEMKEGKNKNASRTTKHCVSIMSEKKDKNSSDHKISTSGQKLQTADKSERKRQNVKESSNKSDHVTKGSEKSAEPSKVIKHVTKGSEKSAEPSKVIKHVTKGSEKSAEPSKVIKLVTMGSEKSAEPSKVIKLVPSPAKSMLLTKRNKSSESGFIRQNLPSKVLDDRGKSAKANILKDWKMSDKSMPLKQSEKHKALPSEKKYKSSGVTSVGKIKTLDGLKTQNDSPSSKQKKSLWKQLRKFEGKSIKRKKTNTSLLNAKKSLCTDVKVSNKTLKPTAKNSHDKTVSSGAINNNQGIAVGMDTDIDKDKNGMVSNIDNDKKNGEKFVEDNLGEGDICGLKIVSVCGNVDFNESVNSELNTSEDEELMEYVKNMNDRPVTPSLDNLDIIMNSSPLKKYNQPIQTTKNNSEKNNDQSKLVVVTMPSLVHKTTRKDSFTGTFVPMETHNSPTDESELDSSCDKLVIDTEQSDSKLSGSSSLEAEQTNISLLNDKEIGESTTETVELLKELSTVDSTTENMHNTDSGNDMSESMHNTESGNDMSESVHNTESGNDMSESVHNTESGNDVSESVHNTESGNDMSESVHNTESGNDMSESVHNTASGNDMSESMHNTESGNDMSESVHNTESGNDMSGSGQVEVNCKAPSTTKDSTSMSHEGSKCIDNDETLIYANSTSDMESSKDTIDYSQDHQNKVESENLQHDLEEYSDGDFDEDDDDIQIMWYIKGVPQSPWTPATPHIKQESTNEGEEEDDEFKQPPVLPELDEYFKKNPEIFSQTKTANDTSGNSSIVPSSQPDSPQLDDTYCDLFFVNDNPDFKYEATPIVEDTESDDKSEKMEGIHDTEEGTEKVVSPGERKSTEKDSNLDRLSNLRFDKYPEKIQAFKNKVKKVIYDNNDSAAIDTNHGSKQCIVDQPEISETKCSSTKENENDTALDNLSSTEGSNIAEQPTSKENNSASLDLSQSTENNEVNSEQDRPSSAENNEVNSEQDRPSSAENMYDAIKHHSRQRKTTKPRSGNNQKKLVFGSLLFPPGLQRTNSNDNDDVQIMQQSQQSTFEMAEPTRRLIYSMLLFSRRLTNNGNYEFSHFKPICFTHVKVLLDGTNRNTLGEFIPKKLCDVLLRCVKCLTCNGDYSPYRFMRHVCNVQWKNVSDRSLQNQPIPREQLEGSSQVLWKLMFYVFQMEKHLRSLYCGENTVQQDDRTSKLTKKHWKEIHSNQNTQHNVHPVHMVVNQSQYTAGQYQAAQQVCQQLGNKDRQYQAAQQVSGCQQSGNKDRQYQAAQQMPASQQSNNTTGQYPYQVTSQLPTYQKSVNTARQYQNQATHQIPTGHHLGSLPAYQQQNTRQGGAMANPLLNIHPSANRGIIPHNTQDTNQRPPHHTTTYVISSNRYQPTFQPTSQNEITGQPAYPQVNPSSYANQPTFQPTGQSSQINGSQPIFQPSRQPSQVVGNYHTFLTGGQPINSTNMNVPTMQQSFQTSQPIVNNQMNYLYNSNTASEIHQDTVTGHNRTTLSRQESREKINANKKSPLLRQMVSSNTFSSSVSNLQQQKDGHTNQQSITSVAHQSIKKTPSQKNRSSPNRENSSPSLANNVSNRSRSWSADSNRNETPPSCSRTTPDLPGINGQNPSFSSNERQPLLLPSAKRRKLSDSDNPKARRRLSTTSQEGDHHQNIESSKGILTDNNISSQTSTLASSGLSTTPQTSGIPTTPSASGQVATPSKAGIATTPSTSGLATTPSTSWLPTTPSTSALSATPSTSELVASPSTSGLATTPSTSGQATTPSTLGLATTPSTSGLATTPSTSGQATTPSTLGLATTPSTSGLAATPSTSKPTKTPTISEVAKTSSTLELTSPSASGNTATASGSVTTPSRSSEGQNFMRQLNFQRPEDIIKAFRFGQEIQLQAMNKMMELMNKDKENYEQLEKELEMEKASHVNAQRKLEQLERQFGTIMDCLHKKS